MDNILMMNKEYFCKRLSEEGDNIKALWSNRKSQVDRFEVLSQIGDLEGKSLLDVGCGFGDFYGFLWDKGIKLDEYIGLDISPKTVEVAKSKLPNATILCTDILDFYADGQVDYSIASGIFCLPNDIWEDHVLRVCKKMFDMSRIGIGVNFISVFSSNNGQREDSYYAEPYKVLKLLMRGISHKVILRHDYRLNDFTVFIYKDDK